MDFNKGEYSSLSSVKIRNSSLLLANLNSRSAAESTSKRLISPTILSPIPWILSRSLLDAENTSRGEPNPCTRR
ncbi:MAG: hypothetical protein VX186_03480 [Nitrospinota bacterium]|nr:hypothetical protein [Nitrospinota bacterium]